MVNKPSSSNASRALECVALNLFVYLEYTGARNERIGDIIRKSTGDPAIIDMLKVYVNDNPEMKNFILLEQSKDIYNPTPKVTYDTRGFNAYTIKNPYNDNYIIVYKGTANGGWIQNGVAFGSPQDNIYYSYEKNTIGEIFIAETKVVNEHLSTVQAYAINYFLYNAVKYEWSEISNITVTGYSQGGCNAKLVTLSSHLVDSCYDFNGPNFSKETIAELQINKEQYETQRKKIVLYRTDNDQISIFGHEVVEDEQIYYVKGKSSIVNHELEKMVSLLFDEYGNLKITFNEYCEGRSFLSNTLKKYNNILMELPVEMRGAVAIGTMWFAQSFLGREKSVFDDHVELWKICLAVVTSGMIIPKAIMQSVSDKYGFIAKYIAAMIMVFATIIISPLLFQVYGSFAVVGLIDFVIDKMRSSGNQFVDVTNQFVDLLVEI